MDCYSHYLERFSYYQTEKKKDTSEQAPTTNTTTTTTTITKKTSNKNQSLHKQYVFPRFQSLGSPHHYHYLNHLLFDE